MIDKWNRPVARIMNDVAKRRVTESAAAAQASQRDWWKPLEAMLGLMGGIADDLDMLLDEDKDVGRQPTIDLPWFFDNVIPGLLSQSSAYHAELSSPQMRSSSRAVLLFSPRSLRASSRRQSHSSTSRPPSRRLAIHLQACL